MRYRKWQKVYSCFFFFNDTATTEIYTLSLHDALPIYQIKRRTFSSSRFGQRKRAGVKIERGRNAAAVRHDPVFLPMEPSGDHQMEDKPEVVIEPEDDAFAGTAQLSYGVALDRLDRRRSRPQQRRTSTLYSLQLVLQHNHLQRLNVNRDVGQLRQSAHLLPPQIAIEKLLHAED